jgi:hypothetical protein
MMAPIGAQQYQQPANNNAFMQNKYQFATYYGQKPNYPQAP